ncbi:50S ribosomal protein L29 [Candidatus Roizmanbacteria bacterium]|nr:50S ribosomal protein L29 [Candidatus Roizmanbacteria bacterium]
MKKITKTYQEKTSQELIKETQLLREEIAKLQLSFKGNPPKDTNLLMKKRKQLAVLLTILGEKEEVGAG